MCERVCKHKSSRKGVLCCCNILTHTLTFVSPLLTHTLTVVFVFLLLTHTLTFVSLLLTHTLTFVSPLLIQSVAGKPFVECLREQGVEPGIKVDEVCLKT